MSVQLLDAGDEKPIGAGEDHQRVQASHLAVVGDDLDDHPGGPTAGEPGEVDRGFGVSLAGEYAAAACDEREDVPGAL